MARTPGRRFTNRGGRNGRPRRSRRTGCLLWLIVLLILLVVLSLLFGGFHKGTKAGGILPPAPPRLTAAAWPGRPAFEPRVLIEGDPLQVPLRRSPARTVAR